MLTATSTMAPIHSFRLTSRNKADSAAQATAFELVSRAAHNLILPLVLQSVTRLQRSRPPSAGCTRADGTASSCFGHGALRPLHTSSKKPGAASLSAGCCQHASAGWTFSTLFGLIATTGLRISEALALDADDVDLEIGVLTIRRGKARLVPIDNSVTQRLRAYVDEREQLLGFAPPSFFTTERGTRPDDCSARSNFALVCQRLERQFELLGVARQLLRGTAKLRPPRVKPVG
jgi:hypothetical protein